MTFCVDVGGEVPFRTSGGGGGGCVLLGRACQCRHYNGKAFKKLRALSNRPLLHEALSCLQLRARVTVRGGSNRRGESGSKGIRAVVVDLLPHRPDAH